MYKFNNSTIFTGYLKQLLASFNLPTYRIYTKENQKYFDRYGEESPEIIKTIAKDDDDTTTLTRYIPYIKDGEIYEYRCFPVKDALNRLKDLNKSTGQKLEYTCEWVRVSSYYDNQDVENFSKRLAIKNNIYDTYTHEYLGNYLRFLRDYYNINLMPLYNCFSNKLCTNLSLECEHYDISRKETLHFIFNSSDKQYKIYMFPVKLFKKYTIAIDCDSPVEICCGVYGKYQATDDSFKVLSHDTYKRYGRMSFNKPVLYTKLLNLYDQLTIDTVSHLASREQDLKMFIKIPTNNKSSITVLEGDYLNWNDSVTTAVDDNMANKNYTNYILSRNHYVTNYYNEEKQDIISNIDYLNTREFKPIGHLQLLAMNTNESYPFANILVDYLSENAITPNDDLEDNVKRINTVLSNATSLENISESSWDGRTNAVIYDKLAKQSVILEKVDNKEQVKLHTSNVKQNELYDTLGYIDHKAEKNYGYYDNKEKSFITISSVDIYTDLYKDSKSK